MFESIQSFVQGNVLVLDESTSVKEAARAMYERRVGSVVVHDRHGRMVGMVTDRDLTCQVLAFGLSPKTPLKEVMTLDVATLKSHQKLSDAVAIMKENGIRRLPVIEKTKNKKTKCVGMLTLDDLLVAQAVDLMTISKIVRAQVVKRFKKLGKSKNRAIARSEHKLNHLYKHLVDSMKLERGVGEQVATHLLHSIVRSLPYSEAVQFISQLPKLIQDELFDLPAGPDRTITVQSLKSELKSLFELNESQIEFAVRGFWVALKEVMKDSIELDRVLRGLPMGFGKLFLQPSKKMSLSVQKINKEKLPAFDYV